MRSDSPRATAGVAPDAERIQRDAQRVFDAVRGGGVALIPLDVAYALVAATPKAVRRVYEAKGRDFSKPMGIVGGLAAHRALHQLSDIARAMVYSVTVTHDLPLSVVAPYRADHPYLQRLDAFVLRQSTLDGTLNLLLNAGALRTRLAGLCWESGIPMAGTSANVSMTGSLYTAQSMERGILDICDVVIDYGKSRFHNPERLSSTIIDFDRMRVIRRGVCFERIRDLLHDEFGLTVQ